MDKYIGEAVSNIMKELSAKEDDLKPLGLGLDGIKVILKIYPILIESDICFIPTGTPDAPSGIATFEKEGGRLICITNKSDISKIIYLKDFKALLKENKAEAIDLGFVRGVGPDFEVMGFSITSDRIIQILNNIDNKVDE